MNEKPLLFSYWRSSCSWRVRIALAMKNVDYEYRAVNLLKGEQRLNEMKELNPSKAVPVLYIDGQSLNQSLAIMEYLEETVHSGENLLPTDPILRAKTRAVSQMIASDIQPVQNLKVLQYVGEEKNKEFARHFIQNGLISVEEFVKSTKGKYCIGDQVTMADICLIPQLYNARRFNVDLDLIPTLLEIEKNCVELLAFIKADPKVQPDAITS